MISLGIEVIPIILSRVEDTKLILFFQMMKEDKSQCYASYRINRARMTNMASESKNRHKFS
jgi:hypothetical protein